MRLLRGLGGALLWIVAALLGLVGVLLCVTVILLPLGIPLTRFAGGLFTRSVQLMLPRALAHPVKEVTKAADKKVGDIQSVTSKTAGRAKKNAKKTRKVVRKKSKSLV